MNEELKRWRAREWYRDNRKRANENKRKYRAKLKALQNSNKAMSDTQTEAPVEAPAEPQAETPAAE